MSLSYMILMLVIILIVNSLFFFIFFLILKKQNLNDIKIHQEQFLQLAGQQFSAEQNRATMELETRKQAVESSVQSLRQELDKYAKLVHEFEKDRDQKYGNLETELKKASFETSRLQDTTNHLTSILGNVKKRGEWGERMAEDIIQACGLQAGINYQKQKQQDHAKTKPDYTFFLPNSYKINMDVKFPLNNYLNMVNAKEDQQKDFFKKAFISDSRARMKEIQNREYIDPDQGTLDFVLLFIPNEQVYGFIQENDPALMDEALKQKIVLCSPFTLYAMLSVIRQAFENFHYENAIKKIIHLINSFHKEYDRFRDRFVSLGDAIQKANVLYDDLNQKNFKRLSDYIGKIEAYKTGNLPEDQAEAVLDADPCVDS
jgi:DNA recombination protein RmuC